MANKRTLNFKVTVSYDVDACAADAAYSPVMTAVRTEIGSIIMRNIRDRFPIDQVVGVRVALENRRCMSCIDRERIELGYAVFYGTEVM